MKLLLLLTAHLAFTPVDTVSVPKRETFRAIPVSLLFTGMSGAFADTVNTRFTPGFSVGWAEYKARGRWTYVFETLYMHQAYRQQYEGQWLTNRIHYLYSHAQYRTPRQPNGFYGGLGCLFSVRLRERKNGEAVWWLIPFLEVGPSLSVGKYWSRGFSVELRGAKPVFNLLKGFRHNPVYTVGVGLNYEFR